MFIGNRMLYGRAALNARREVRFGLRHIRKPTQSSCLTSTNSPDALNRYQRRLLDNPFSVNTVEQDVINQKNRETTIRVMMYIFPREFGLHNAFTSVVDSRDTSQPFNDYTLREDEICSKYREGPWTVPKRLRGAAMELVKKFQILHSRCPYSELLKYYCPVIVSS
jgi:telomerase reverse transcriptase